MASLTAKVVHGHKYFQIITSRRINGKPRQVVLAHLGTADTLFARLQQKQGEPIKARVQPFGFLAAAWGLAQKLQLVSLIDRHVPKRQQGASGWKKPVLGERVTHAAASNSAQNTESVRGEMMLLHGHLSNTY